MSLMISAGLYMEGSILTIKTEGSLDSDPDNLTLQVVINGTCGISPFGKAYVQILYYANHSKLQMPVMISVE